METVYFKADDRDALISAFPEFVTDHGLASHVLDTDGERMDLIIYGKICSNPDEVDADGLSVPQEFLDGYHADVVCTPSQAARFADHPLRIPPPSTPAFVLSV